LQPRSVCCTRFCVCCQRVTSCNGYLRVCILSFYLKMKTEPAFENRAFSFILQ
jgi:hypothetical protein